MNTIISNKLKKSLFILILFTAAVCVFAQDESEDTVKNRKIAISLGPEFNMNSRENFAGGMVLGFDVSFASAFAAGITVTASYNFFEIFVLEPSALFRWYFLGKKTLRFLCSS
ncbi:MAG: hypothetical protein FWB77_03355 [Treponema sp.]|nr:hypothetical protein [Treponema sp.]